MRINPIDTIKFSTGTGASSAINSNKGMGKAFENSGITGTEKGSFGDLLKNKIAEVDQAQKTADVVTTDFATGKSRNLHEAVLALEMADTSLRMLVTVRNKALEAYQEIMKMPV